MRLSSQIVTKKTHQNENPCKVSSLPVQEGESLEGLLDLPFLEDKSKKKQDFEIYKKQEIAYGNQKVPKNASSE